MTTTKELIDFLREAEYADLMCTKYLCEKIFFAEVIKKLEAAEKMEEALERSRRKLEAYVGCCTGDKELTKTVIPLCREALAAWNATEKEGE